jgi:hypothetical protein
MPWPIHVVPANAGTHNPRPLDSSEEHAHHSRMPATAVFMGPGVRRDDEWSLL